MKSEQVQMDIVTKLTSFRGFIDDVEQCIKEGSSPDYMDQRVNRLARAFCGLMQDIGILQGMTSYKEE